MTAVLVITDFLTADFWHSASCSFNCPRSGDEANASPRLGSRASAERFYKIAGQPFLVVRRCAGGIGERFLLGGEKRFEAIFVDRFHESFMRGDNAFFEQRPDGVVHELHSLRLCRKRSHPAAFASRLRE